MKRFINFFIRMFSLIFQKKKTESQDVPSQHKVVIARIKPIFNNRKLTGGRVKFRKLKTATLS